MSQRELTDPEYAENIFTRIIAREAPAHIVYEDARTIAFLDTGAIAEGHTLLVPKEAARTIDELSDESAAALGRVMPRLSRALREVTGAQDLNIVQNNGILASQTVFHVHFHLVPKPDPERGIIFKTVERHFDEQAGALFARRFRAAIETSGIHNEKPAGLAELVLVVDDVHASVRFYRDLLGLTLEREHNDDWAWFRMPDGSRLACTRATLLFSEHSPRTDLPQAKRLAGPVHFALQCDDPAPALGRLKDASIEVHGPTEFEWMGARSWYAYDPDGNLAELWQPLAE